MSTKKKFLLLQLVNPMSHSVSSFLFSGWVLFYFMQDMLVFNLVQGGEQKFPTQAVL